MSTRHSLSAYNLWASLALQALFTNHRPTPSSDSQPWKTTKQCYFWNCWGGFDCSDLTSIWSRRRRSLCFHNQFVSSQSLIGGAFPRVLPAAGQLLNCNLDSICCKYKWVLNQLANRHLLFHKLIRIGCNLDALTKAQFLVRMNKVDKELKDFMKFAKKGCHKYIGGYIEWCPETGVWMKRCWLLGQVQVFLNGRTRDPRNLQTVTSMG